MSFQNPRLWSAHTENEALFLHTGIIGIGWGETGSLSDLPEEREAYRERVDAAYPDESAAGRSLCANLLYRLVREVRTGDYVVFCCGERVHLGVVSGEYAYDGSTPECAHRRPVTWLRDLPRTGFSREALRETAGSPVPLFLVKRYAGGFFEAMGVAFLWEERPAPKKAAQTVSDSTSPAVLPVSAPVRPAAPPVSVPPADTVSFVLNRWAAMAESGKLLSFTVSLLRAMDYLAEADGDGLNVSRDELTTPVRVTAGADGLRVYRPEGVRLIGGKELAELILRHYAALDSAEQNRIPLRLEYVPNSGDEERRTEVRRF